jgi:L1 cell adhesion molecule like protein
LCGDYFRKCLLPVEKVLRDAGMSKRDVDEVVLVGGSTRIPKIQELIQAFFNGKEPSRSVNPDEAVANGAAVQADSLTGGKNMGANQDPTLLDVNALSLGIETAGGLMATIVERNSTIPTRKEQVFSTQVDNQPGVTIQVIEGECTRTADNHKLGTFELAIAPAPRGTPQIAVSFDLDTDGILRVTAEDKATGKKNAVTITNESGRLSAAEVESMIRKSDAFKVQDEEHAESVRARNLFEQFVYASRDSLERATSAASDVDSGDDSSETEKEAVTARSCAREALKEALEWLNSGEEEASAALVEKRRVRLDKAMAPVLLAMSNDATSHSSSAPVPVEEDDDDDGGGDEPATGPLVEEVD